MENKFIVDCSPVPPNFEEKTFTNSHKTLKFSKVSHYTVGRLSFWNSDQKLALFLGLYAFISLFLVQNSHNAGVEIKLRTVVLLLYSLTVELLMNNTPLFPGGNLLISKTNLLGYLLSWRDIYLTFDLFPVHGHLLHRHSQLLSYVQQLHIKGPEQESQQLLRIGLSY